jgi:dephospho-CoA kinase
MQRKTIIGLIGLPGSGKSTIAEYLKSKGFQHIILSDIIKTQMKKKGVVRFNRKNLQEYGNLLREKFGPHALILFASQEINSSKESKFVIDGIRNVGEINYLRKISNVYIYGIKTSKSLRLKRLIKSGRNKDPKTMKLLLDREKRENSLGNKKTGLRVKDCLKHTDKNIMNNKSINSLYQKVDQELIKLNRYL